MKYVSDAVEPDKYKTGLCKMQLQSRDDINIEP